MNIENFPTSEAAKRMMGYITGNGFYDRSYVGKWIFQVMGIEMDEARRIIEDELPYQAFPETATWGLRYHEEKFGLPIRENLSPEERRKLILDRRDTKAPITPWRLEKMMNSVLGCDVKVVDIHEPDNKITHPNTFVVYLEGEGAFSLQKGIDKINDAKQSHTSYELHVRLAVFVLVENILFNRMTVRLQITWWGASFDGRYLFDGEALLNAVRPPDFRAVTYNLDADHAEGVLFEHTKISAVEIKNENECKIRDVHRASFLWTDYVITFDGELSFDGDETFSQESPPKIVSITHRMDAENVEDFGVVLYIPSKAARFNGVLNFDGTNNFNSGREDL